MLLKRERIRGFVDGGSHPRAVALAVVFGIVAGFVTGWNLSLALILLAVLLLDVRTRVFLMAWGGSVIVARLLEPITGRIGYVLLDGSPLGPVIGQLGDHPLVALLGWDHYRLVGGVAVGIVVAWPLGGAAARLVCRLRKSVSVAKPVSSDRWVDHEDPFPRPRLVALDRFWRRVLFGRVTSETGVPHEEVLALAAEAEDSCSPRPARLFRPLGWAGALPAIGLVTLAVYDLGPVLLRHAVLAQFGEFNRATVEAEDFNLSLASGTFHIRGLAFADPGDLTHDRVRIERLSGRLNPGRLLRGTLEIDSVDAWGVNFDVARRVQAQLCGPKDLPLAANTRRKPYVAALGQESGLWQADHAVRDWPRLKQQLAAVGGLIDELDHLAAYDKQHSPSRALFALLARPWSKRSSLGISVPLVKVDEINLQQVADPIGPGLRGKIKIVNLSSYSRPDTGELVMTIIAPEAGAEIEARMNLYGSKKPWPLSLRAYDLDLASLIDQDGLAGRLRVRRGHVDLVGHGTFDRQAVDLRLEVDAEELKATVAGATKPGGIGSQLWNEGLRRAGRLRGEFHLVGDWQSPHVMVDPQSLVRQLKHRLRAQGHHELVAAIESELATANDHRLAAHDTTAQRPPAAAPPDQAAPATGVATEVGVPTAPETIASQTSRSPNRGPGSSQSASANLPSDQTAEKVTSPLGGTGDLPPSAAAAVADSADSTPGVSGAAPQPVEAPQPVDWQIGYDQAPVDPVAVRSLTGRRAPPSPVDLNIDYEDRSAPATDGDVAPPGVATTATRPRPRAAAGAAAPAVPRDPATTAARSEPRRRALPSPSPKAPSWSVRAWQKLTRIVSRRHDTNGAPSPGKPLVARRTKPRAHSEIDPHPKTAAPRAGSAISGQNTASEPSGPAWFEQLWR